MNFADRVFFASMMALLEEIEEEERIASEDGYLTDSYEYSVPQFGFNAAYFIDKLCNITQSLFDAADAACNTASDTQPKDLIPAMICGVIYETVRVLTITDAEKKDIYKKATQVCGVASLFPGEYLFHNIDVELPQSLTMLTEMGFSMIVTASEKASDGEAAIGFAKVFSELMISVEKSMTEMYPHIYFNKRPSLLAVEKMLNSAKKQLKIIEKDHPELKETGPAKKRHYDKDRISILLNYARNEKRKGNMYQAGVYYKKVKEIQQDNWEAYFYSVFCDVHHSVDNVDPDAIPNYTKQVINCIPKVISLAKKQLYSRDEIIDGIGDVAIRVTEIASNYFVASLNRYKRLKKTAASDNEKNAQVYEIIRMLFVVGDSIEDHFGEDPELCAYTACSCWKIAFDCYENCNMSVPEGMADHFRKMRKYIPDFQCTKPIMVSTSNSLRKKDSTARKSQGCYIATAVYGSYNCPPVWVLRRFRDYFLWDKWYGRLFIHIYYTVSPSVVKVFKNAEWFTKIFKWLIDKLVECLIRKGYENTEYDDIPCDKLLDE